MNGLQAVSISQEAQLQPQAALNQETPEELTCNICKELFQAAVTIKKCNHSFCSFCIRLNLAEQSKKLKSKVCCPVCRDPLFERSFNQADKVLRVNVNLQMKVSIFKQKELSGKQEEETSPRRRSTRRSSPQPEPQAPPPRKNPTLQRLTQVTYHGKKRNALAALLKPHGLSTIGTEDELKSRHSRFVLYWNSLCDECVDPPSKDTVIQQFRSSELKRDAARYQTSMLSTSVEPATDETEARAARLQEHAEGFRALYQTILENFVDKWGNTNLSLAIAVLQHNPVIQNDNFRQCLRERAMKGNYQIKIKKLLSGDEPLPESIPNLLPTVTSTGGGTASQHSASSYQPSKKRQLSDDQLPSEILDYTKRQKLNNTTATVQQPQPVSNPYRKNRNNQASQATNHASSSQPAPPSLSVDDRWARVDRMLVESTANPTVEQRYARLDQMIHENNAQPQRSSGFLAPSVADAHSSNPYSAGYQAGKPSTATAASNQPLTLSGTTKSLATVAVNHQPLQQQNHYNHMATVQRGQANTMPRAVMVLARGPAYTSSAPMPTPPTTATSTTPASTHQRHAVSPPTVATSKPSFFQNKPPKKKPSWHWTCSVCQYVMQMDPKAIICSMCGCAKGATFDSLHEQAAMKSDTTKGSSEDPIEMC